MPSPLLFCHGLESAPIGRKSQGLIDLGYDVTAPDCRGQGLAARVDILTDAIAAFESAPLVVGSSFGGIAGLIAVILAHRAGTSVAGLVLCAPALQLPPPADTVTDLAPPCPTIVVHGTGDDVIPIAHSRSFCDRYGCPLVEVDDTHGLPNAGFAAIVGAVKDLAGSR